MVAPLRAFERALSQRPISLLLARKTLDNNNKIRESSASPEAKSKTRKRGSDNAGAFIAPAPAGVMQTMARLLSSPATASFDGVIDGGKSRCGLGGTPSPA
jgi:hypothetical protein